MVESVPELLLPHHADALLLINWGDFGLAILGKEIIHRLSEQGLYGRLTFRSQYPELLFDGRRKIPGHV